MQAVGTDLRDNIMNFKYFDNADKFVGLRDEETKCGCCRQTKLCFDTESYYGSTGFFGNKKIKSICPECLASGQLNKFDMSTCTGDVSELKRQLKSLNPQLAESELENLVKTKTNELETTTPQLITWQDWNWPSADGDYCKFIGYGSKPLFNKLSNGPSGKDFFLHTLYKVADTADFEYLWNDFMPDQEVNSYEDSSQYGTLFYVFKSLNSDKIMTTWDSN